MKTYTVWLPIAESGLRLANAGELETIIFIFIFCFGWVFISIYSHVDSERASISFVNGMDDYKLAIT